MYDVSSFTQFITSELNDAQRTAVLHKQGALLVVAGAGSGKTRVITARITQLILHEGVFPESIIALTFTNKAANEMKHRISGFLPQKHNLPFVGTFHAYCLRILKRYGYHCGLDTFTILDDDDQKKMVSDILRTRGLHKTLNARTVLYQISHVKNNPDRVHEYTSAADKMIGEIHQQYEREKKASKCLDFDDLMLYVLTLFKTNSTFKEEHRARVRHVLVDEYQDTNYVQHELLKQMTLEKGDLCIDSVCAVGDEDQSIYSWRGATVTNILTFSIQFPNTTVVKIEQNYRSAHQILEVANRVIANNSQRTPKQLWSVKQGTDRVRLVTCASEYQEADMITQLSTVVATEKKQRSLAVLYRTHAQSRSIEEALIKRSIPYKVIGGVQFYERKEIKDLLAYIRVLVNPFDRPSFYRILNVPGRGLGQKFEELVANEWDHEPLLNGLQVVQSMIEQSIITRKAQLDALKSFASIFTNIDVSSAPSVLLKYLIEKTRYLEYLQHEYTGPEAQERIDNVQELLDAIRYAESQRSLTVESLLEEIALMQDALQATHNQPHDTSTVLLMTIHAAKGLEFDVVVLSGLEEGIMPTSRAGDDSNAIEEERRLFYVGITRARDYVLMVHAKMRYTYGTLVEQRPSRFLDEVAGHLVRKESATYWQPYQQKQFFADWLQVPLVQPCMTFGAGKSTMAEYTAAKAATVSASPKTFKKPSTYGAVAVKPAVSSSGEREWRATQVVFHEQYGHGVVTHIEKRGDGHVVTVRFKSGIKKISATFLRRVTT